MLDAVRALALATIVAERERILTTSALRRIAYSVIAVPEDLVRSLDNDERAEYVSRCKKMEHSLQLEMEL